MRGQSTADYAREGLRADNRAVAGKSRGWREVLRCISPQVECWVGMRGNIVSYDGILFFSIHWIKFEVGECPFDCLIFRGRMIMFEFVQRVAGILWKSKRKGA